MLQGRDGQDINAMEAERRINVFHKGELEDAVVEDAFELHLEGQSKSRCEEQQWYRKQERRRKPENGGAFLE